MPRTVARPEPRRRLSWPDHAPAVGIHLGVARGLLKAGRRARQIGAQALQIFSDNPTAWRRRPAAPPDAGAFIDYTAGAGIAPIAIHASYLINLAARSEPFASRSRAGLVTELLRAGDYGATLVNTHIGSHLGDARADALQRVGRGVAAVLAESPAGAVLVLENSAGGGGTLGTSIEELATILEAVTGDTSRLGFCLDTAHLWGAGYDVGSAEGATAVIDRFVELIGLERLRLVHLNDSKSLRGSRSDRHEHAGAGRIGPAGLGTLLRDPRLRRTAFILETPGEEEGYDAVNLRRARLLFGGAETLPQLPPRAFRLNRRSTRSGVGSRGQTREEG
jgi:deoxyribonuclease-4